MLDAEGPVGALEVFEALKGILLEFLNLVP